jgi:hypothetical protein
MMRMDLLISVGELFSPACRPIDKVEPTCRWVIREARHRIVRIMPN